MNLDFLTDIIDWFNSGINYYAVSLILFTLCIRVLVLPLDIKSRKGMRKMAKIQPKINELQKKYANDQAKLQKKQQELMRQEHYNPLSGCLPMLLQYPILILMFYAMRSVANREMARQILQAIAGNENPVNHNETFLWIKNLWTADSFFASIAPSTSVFAQVGADTWMKAFERLSAPEQLACLKNILYYDTMSGMGSGLLGTSFGGTIESVLQMKDFGGPENVISIMREYINGVVSVNTSGCSGSCFMCTLCGGTTNSYAHNAIQDAYTASAFFKNNQRIVTSVPILGNLYWPSNGYMVLAVLSLGSQILMTKLNPTTQPEQPVKAGEEQKGAGTAKFMKYFFPIFSFYCCVSSYAAFALYWVASNLIMIGLTAGINKYLDKKEAKEGNASNNKTITGEGKIR
ncbi:MAG: hypothetical protein CW338_09450 [Clostridiales bacterium]|nr:hypothetical protein [Clostridiales bacterium]